MSGWGKIAREFEPYIGRTGLLTVVETRSDKSKVRFRFPITVIDAKRCWGQLRFEVKPRGTRNDLGSGWVGANRVQLDEVTK